jgi:sec-independent protein translocase protein TatA
MGIGEILILLLIILVVFGSSRLPGIARGLGKGIRNFKDATKEDRPPDES